VFVCSPSVGMHVLRVRHIFTYFLDCNILHTVLWSTWQPGLARTFCDDDAQLHTAILSHSITFSLWTQNLPFR